MCFNCSYLDIVEIDCPRDDKRKVDESGDANSIFGLSDDPCEVY